MLLQTSKSHTVRQYQIFMNPVLSTRSVPATYSTTFRHNPPEDLFAIYINWLYLHDQSVK